MDISLQVLIILANTSIVKLLPKWSPANASWEAKTRYMLPDDIKDIKAVAAGTADGAFYNNGQSCCAVERIYVHENV